MVIWAIFGLYPWPATAGRFRPIGSTILLFILLLLLGWGIFGAPVKG
jgi:hypothetical protein